ncbi:hypothetical protein B0I27_109107 [Arcticibacter pallidicorallinus]|uniref:Uncharacterized protein n=1 Tax=Arcticibacter pallidicorallinus TaxID=1259464 RepID=A0A2T0TXI1_9SPHI|nr:hypothetical protein [Arcticibacter pallidicorallinus]PRY50384.1 hypothetical protein B0I27_109107 [Arcticibacter pallidicorallinus]
MSFLKNLFKTKEGGTKIGNLIRKVAKPAVKAIAGGVGTLVGGPAGAALGAKIGGAIAGGIANGKNLKQAQPEPESESTQHEVSAEMAQTSQEPLSVNPQIMSDTSDKRSIIDEIAASVKWQGSGGNTNEVSFGSQSPQAASDDKTILFAVMGLAAIVLLNNKR